MPAETIRVLLIEDNAGDARLIMEALADVEDGRFEVEREERLSTGLTRLAEGEFQVLLLDLSLPDSSGFSTFTKAHSQAEDMPILVLTGFDDDAVAVEAVRKGAQDYLVKGRISGEMLARSIRYGIERHRLVAEQRKLALIDELTGLNNRRSFLTLYQQHAKLACRNGTPLTLMFIDLDHFKAINDTHGHNEGDRALVDVADILRRTFRESDVIARLGGDEFSVLLTQAGSDAAAIARVRLSENLLSHNTTAERPYELALSVGLSGYDPKNPRSVDEILADADKAMYDDKMAKRR